MGTNLLVVLAGSANMGGVRTGSSAVKTLIVDDMTAILRECTAVKDAAPGVQTRGQVIYQNQNWAPSGGITGTSPDYFDVRSWPIKDGVSFDKSEVDRAAHVAGLGTTVVSTMFGGENPIGKTIRIKNLPFKVIGVTSSKGQSSFGQDQDDIVFVPYTTVQKKLAGVTWLQTIHVQAVSGEATALAQQQIETLLRERHRMRSDEDNHFNVRNLADVAQLAEESGRVMTLLLGSIASVSLIVGGIGIMNIMLVSVTERTREIGIRQAVGAKTHDILMQFLVEAVTLSLLGGIIGIVVGLTASVLISHFAHWATQVSPMSIQIGRAS